MEAPGQALNHPPSASLGQWPMSDAQGQQKWDKSRSSAGQAGRLCYGTPFLLPWGRVAEGTSAPGTGELDLQGMQDEEGLLRPCLLLSPTSTGCWCPSGCWEDHEAEWSGQDTPRAALDISIQAGEGEVIPHG